MTIRTFAILLLFFVSLPSHGQETFTITTYAVNLYANPTLTSKLINTLSKGEQVKKLSTERNWVHVETLHTGDIGWIYAPQQRSLMRLKPKSEIAHAQPHPEPTNDAKIINITLSITSNAANLRATPHQTGRIITVLRKGVRLMKLNTKRDWVQVKTLQSGIIGWVYAPPQRWFKQHKPSSIIQAPQRAHPDLPAAAGSIKKKQPIVDNTFPLSSVNRAIAPRIFSTVIPIRQLIIRMDKLDAEVLFKKEPYDKSSFPITLETPDGDLKGRVEVKGSSSRHFLKKSLLIKLEKGADWHGQSKISLNAMSTDPSNMRESLSWDLIDALGMIRPQVEYMRLIINNRSIGIFLRFEWITPKLFPRFGISQQAQLFHPNDSLFCGDLSAANMERLEECWFNLTPQNGSYSALHNLAREIANTPVADFHTLVENRFNADSLINWMIVNTLTSNGDSYNKNYFLLRDKLDGRWHVIPWDYDLSFGRNADPVLPYPQNIINDNFQYYYSPELGSPSPLKEKLLRNPQLYKKFKDRLAHVLGLQPDPAAQGGFGWFTPNNFHRRVNDLLQSIEKPLRNDIYHPVDPETLAQQTIALQQYNLFRYHYLKKLVLEQTVLGTSHWLPYTAYPKLTLVLPRDGDTAPKRVHTPLSLSATLKAEDRGDQLVFIDEQFSRPLGILEVGQLSKPSRIRLDVEMEHIPDHLPMGVIANTCIQRSWFLDIRKPHTTVVVDITFDYLQENSLHHELGDAILEEENLQLWAFADNLWRTLPTRVNSISNTLITQGFKIPSTQLVRFVACETG
ncbi:CotH kinase family protein [Beggiatoa alba]|nr:CotH kinase family protein [Beggiatoa alba]